jgi:hypothetical protein
LAVDVGDVDQFVARLEPLVSFVDGLGKGEFDHLG